MDLGSSPSLDNDHGAAAVGTSPERTGLLGRGDGWFDLWLRERAEYLPAKRQQSGAPPVGKEAEVADANETFGEQVPQETAQKLIERQGHQVMLIVVGRVAPAKGNFLVGRGDKSMVGDGDAMGVAAQVLQNILRTTEGWFGVDHPVLREQEPQPGREDLRLSE